MDDVEFTTGGKVYLDRSSKTLAEIFKNDPIIRYMTSSISKDAHQAYLPSYMHTLLTAGMLNKAIFEEINDWSSCAVWVPPGERIDGPITILRAGFIPCVLKLGLSGMQRMLVEWVPQAEKSKQKHLGLGQKHHYLFFIGTLEHSRGQGLATKFIRRKQGEVAGDGYPIWLEATTPRSRDVYARCGFRVLDVITLGKGTHDELGERKTNGPGVKAWTMVWYPGEK